MNIFEFVEHISLEDQSCIIIKGNAMHIDEILAIASNPVQIGYQELDDNEYMDQIHSTPLRRMLRDLKLNTEPTSPQALAILAQIRARKNK